MSTIPPSGPVPARITLARADIIIARADVERAAAAGLIGAEQVGPLWDFLGGAAAGAQRARFSFGHTLYYFGGLLAIGAMSVFMTLSWDALGPWGMCVLALLYGAACWAAAEVLHRRGYGIPAGLLGALAVFLVPLAVFCAQHALGLWPELDGAVSGLRFSQYHQWVDGRWLVLEAASLIAGGLALWRLRLPFLVMPVALTLWYMSMDLSRWPPGQDWDFDHARRISLLFGLAMCAGAGVLDVRSRRRGGPDYAGWLYLFGAFAAWGALTASPESGEWARLAYAVFNAGLVLFGAVIGRRVFTVLGAIGVAAYLGYLAFELFRDSLLFPLALSLLGLALVGADIWGQRHEAAIRAGIQARLPALRRPGGH